MRLWLALAVWLPVAACGRSTSDDGGEDDAGASGKSGTGGSGHGAAAGSGTTAAGSSTVGSSGSTASGGATTANGGNATASGGDSGAPAAGGTSGVGGTTAGMANDAGSPATGGTDPGEAGAPPVDCEPKPDPPGGTALASNCLLTGTVVLAGGGDPAGTHIWVEKEGGEVVTGDDGSFEIPMNAAGEQRLVFQNGDYGEYLSISSCGSDLQQRFQDNPVELYRGIHVSASEPLRLDTPPWERAVNGYWVVDRTCGAATELPCGPTATSDDGRVLVCIGTVLKVPADPKLAKSIAFDGTVVGRAGRVVAGADGFSTVHALDVASETSRPFGKTANFSTVQLAGDEAHVVYTSEAGEITVAPTTGTEKPRVLGTFANDGLMLHDELVVLSPDGRWVAFRDHNCQGECEVFLSDMEGTVRSLGKANTASPLLFDPNSEYLLAYTTQPTGGYESFSLAEGTSQKFDPPASAPIHFAAGGTRIIYGSLDVADVAGGSALLTLDGYFVNDVSPDYNWAVIGNGTIGAAPTYPAAVLDTVHLDYQDFEPELHWQTALTWANNSTFVAFAAGNSERSYKRLTLDVSLTVKTLTTGSSDLGAYTAVSEDSTWLAFSDGPSVYIADWEEPPRLVTTRYLGNGLAWLGNTGVLAELGDVVTSAQYGTYLFFP